MIDIGADARTITRQTAGMVATELGDGWKVDTDPALAEHRGAYIDGPGGARLFLALDWRNTDRVEVSGTFPREAGRRVYPDPVRTAIGVKRDRGPAVIAREVTRRLLPTYLPELARVAGKLDDDRAAQVDREATAAALQGAFPGLNVTRADDHRCTLHAYAGGVSIDATPNYRGSEVALEVRGLPAEVAAEVLRVIARSL